jgi:rhodanese-related sulfurtransferase
MKTADAARLLASEPTARILDVRTAGEFDNAHIAGAYNVPLDQLAEHAAELRAGRAHSVILVCQSGQRAQKAEALLTGAGMPNLHVLEGGMNAWIAGGQAVRRVKARMSLERQVRIAAGFIVAAGALAALAVSVWFAIIPAVIGSGLVFAGVTDTCMMGMALARLPYNRGASCDTEAIVRAFLAHDTKTRS